MALTYWTAAEVSHMDHALQVGFKDHGGRLAYPLGFDGPKTFACITGLDADPEPDTIPGVTKTTLEECPEPYHAGWGTAPPDRSPPVNRDVPHVGQDGWNLHCTMGNWDGEPTSYAYVWQRDNIDVQGTNGPDCIVTAEDVGHVYTCVITAGNAWGSTPVTSDPVTVADEEPASNGRRARHGRRD